MQKFYDFFHFTKYERRGILVLAILTLLILLIPFVYKLTLDDSEFDHSLSKLNPDRTIIFNEAPREYSKTVATKSNSSKKSSISYFRFNPNNLAREEWKKLGLTNKQIDVIYKYESKGGKFRIKEDLKKIYVISDEMYTNLDSYIDIPKDNLSNTNSYKSNSSRSNEEEVIRSFDINLADTVQLLKIRGIGSVLSARILKFRDALGGFYDLDQLKEVYGLSTETQDELLKYAKLGLNNVKLIPINNVTQEELRKHPYINNKQAQLIVNYRNQHGYFSNLIDLGKLHGLDQEFLRKIGPYLKF